MLKPGSFALNGCLKTSAMFTLNAVSTLHCVGPGRFVSLYLHGKAAEHPATAAGGYAVINIATLLVVNRSRSLLISNDR